MPSRNWRVHSRLWLKRNSKADKLDLALCARRDMPVNSQGSTDVRHWNHTLLIVINHTHQHISSCSCHHASKDSWVVTCKMRSIVHSLSLHHLTTLYATSQSRFWIIQVGRISKIIRHRSHEILFNPDYKTVISANSIHKREIVGKNL